MPSAGRPRQSCQRCNSQKVRCSQEKPSCERCIRLKAACRYPSHVKNVDSGAHHQQNTSCIARTNETISAPSERVSLPGTNFRIREEHYLAASDPLSGIPRDLILTLVDTYFSHVYNASLLLHPSSFRADVKGNKVPSHVLLSVCAFGAKFHRDTNGAHALDALGFPRDWAGTAASIVTQNISFPCEDDMVTFMNLALYWYSEGAWQRAFMYKWNSIQIASLFGILRKHTDAQVTTALQVELRRRRFWACFSLLSFGSQTHLCVADSLALAENTPYPCPEGIWDRDDFVEVEQSSDSQERSSYHAEQVQILSLWSQVSHVVKRREGAGDALRDLDSLISAWSSSRSSSSASVLDFPSPELPIRLLTEVLYHQSLCSLHASVVPLFSCGIATNQSDYTKRLSAQIAFDHARSLTRIFRDVLASSMDVARMPSFVGYAAYASSAILMPFLWCEDDVVRREAREDVLTNLAMVRSIGRYWKFVALLGVNANTLYEMHSANPHSLPDIPLKVEASSLDFNLQGSDRVRLSLLSHNEVVWTGNTAKRDEAVIDLGLNGDGVRRNAQVDASAILDSLIAKLEATDDIDAVGHGHFAADSSANMSPSEWDAGLNLIFNDLGSLRESDFLHGSWLSDFEGTM